jgi:hypothetical protein
MIKPSPVMAKMDAKKTAPRAYFFWETCPSPGMIHPRAMKRTALNFMREKY